MSRPRARDAGVTLPEVVVSTAILGLLMAALSVVIVVTLRAAPTTEARIDDARSTRSLANWLSHDTTSTPPFLPESAQGGLDVTTIPTATNNDCSGGGDNLLHLQWAEQGLQGARTYAANYRFETVGDEGRITRYTCWAPGAGSPGTFGNHSAVLVTSNLSPTIPPVITVDQPAAEVESVIFTLTGNSGEQVVVETASRNPAEYFP
jgi:prepilin-type N-terminal cleavage/methylation domain-containing protein